VLFGLAVDAVGVGITFSVSLGTSAASGAAVPLLTQHRDRLFTTQGALITAGVLGVLAGVALFGLAGEKRERPGGGGAARSGRFVRGFAFAMISGVLGSMLNLGLAVGGGIQRAAAERGASPVMVSNAVWLPCLFAGFVPGILYCLYLMKKRGTVAQLRAGARWYYWLAAAAMGVLWFGSVALYGYSSLKLGELGPVIGWPLFMSSIVIASSVAGLWSGEWKHAGKGALGIMAAGVVVLVAAMALLTWAGA
jgi:L-rhamnose-H+ transport protein